MIDMVCDDIKKAIDARAYISALALALTLPDWCGKAAYPKDGPSSRYKKWYSENLGKYETYEGYDGPYLSADVVYSLRNHLLHQGTLDYSNKSVGQEQNKVDSFELYFNHNISDCSSSESSVDPYTGNHYFRKYKVNALNLITKIVLCAKSYYCDNRDKFDFIKLDFIVKE